MTTPFNASSPILQNTSMRASAPPLSGYNQNTTGRMRKLTLLSLGTPDSPFKFPSSYFPSSEERMDERRVTRGFRNPSPIYSDSSSSSDWS
jgi:hypothetical protein